MAVLGGVVSAELLTVWGVLLLPMDRKCAFATPTSVMESICWNVTLVPTPSVSLTQRTAETLEQRLSVYRVQLGCVPVLRSNVSQFNAVVTVSTHAHIFYRCSFGEKFALLFASVCQTVCLGVWMFVAKIAQKLFSWCAIPGSSAKYGWRSSGSRCQSLTSRFLKHLV